MLSIRFLNQWSSGWVSLEVTIFAAVKTFDVNIDNIGNFVLIAKDSIVWNTGVVVSKMVSFLIFVA